MDAAELRGAEAARVYTRPLRPLTRETSAGFACIDFAEQILGIDLYPWQRWTLIHALELRTDGRYRFRTILLLVARQNGKSTLLLVMTLWRMFVERVPLIIGTAQNLDIAEELWSQAIEIVESIPELAKCVEHVDRTNGKKSLRLTTGERYKLAAASRRGGRGLAGDVVLLDELREHHNWDAWAAVSKTTIARRDAQVWAASNAGDAASVVLRHLRALGHQGAGWPDGTDGFEAAAADDDADTLALFEYSAAPHREKRDKLGWAEANPSLGYGIELGSIASAAGTDPDWIFRTEVLCQFVTAAVTGPFPAGAWPKLSVPKVTRNTERGFAYCVDVSADRTMTHVAVAYWDADGLRRVEIAASRAGTDWVLPWLTSPDRVMPVERITLQTAGAPVSSLLGELEAAGITVTPWRGPDLARACGMFYDAVSADTPVLTHGVQPVLDVAAASARIKPLGDGWAIDRRGSPNDAAPLMAVIGAHWLLLTPDRAFVSAYETSDLAMI